jgi:two-component system response regulator LytT
MEKLKIFIVEDESIVAKDIQHSLTKLGYEVVGIANNGKDAIEKIDSLRPDLVLMDIMIKGNLTGIDVSEKVKQTLNIPVIFLTAYADEGTLARAKITEPYGYILKPFKEIDLHSTIEMAVYKHQKDAALLKERDFLYSMVEQDKKDTGVLFVKSANRIVKVLLKDIYFVEALKDYVVINTEFGRYTVHCTMKEMDEKLGTKDFARVHRSFIARLDKIESIDSSNLFLEKEKRTIPVGNNYRESLLKRLNMF